VQIFSTTEQSPEGGSGLRIEVSVTEIVQALTGREWAERMPLPMRSRLGQLAHADFLAKTPPEEREVAIMGEFSSETGWELAISGRIDRVERQKEKLRVVEFKSSALTSEVLNGNSYEPPARFVLQTQIYCYLFARPNSWGGKVKGKLVLHSLVDNGRREIDVPWTVEEVEALLERYVDSQMRWKAERGADWERRRELARMLRWPFGGYRHGQEEIAETVGQVLKEGGDLLMQAPPGLGKTMAVLYPALKYALANGRRIFFATAKGEGRTPIGQAVEMLQQQGAVRVLVMSARRELCPDVSVATTSDCTECGADIAIHTNPIADVWQKPLLTARELNGLATQYHCCPVALAREIMSSADLVVGDYNYVFDPWARLPAFQEPALKDWILLIDEAHNLFDRVRTANSVQVDLPIIRGLMEIITDDLWRWQGAAVAMNSALATLGEALDKVEEDLQQEAGVGNLELNATQWARLAEEVGLAAGRLMATSGEMMDRKTASAIWDVCRTLDRMAILAGQDREVFQTYGNATNDSFGIECLDPSGVCREMFARFDNVVAFSGTLAPLDFHKRALGFGGRPTAVLDAADPFHNSQRLVLAMPAVDSRWRSRPRQAEAVAEVIQRLVRLKRGGYLAVFPSFQFLNMVLPFLKGEGIDILVQQPAMNAASRVALRRKLGRKRRATVALVVAGGQFTEAADYPGDACVGVVVVGPCLPPPEPLREALRQYWSEREEDGYGVAFVYPGMRRVAQAGGRLIRREDDKGVIMLLDDRFLQEPYFGLLPAEWRQVMKTAEENWEEEVREFWQEE
jgi:DNA excision repair protein ERCC-2